MGNKNTGKMLAELRQGDLISLSPAFESNSVGLVLENALVPKDHFTGIITVFWSDGRKQIQRYWSFSRHRMYVLLSPERKGKQ